WAKARSKSRPATRPVRSRASRKGPPVVPGYVVDWRMISWPARRLPRIVSAAFRTGPRSGSFESVMGVGTPTKMASASARRPCRSLADEARAPVAARPARPLVRTASTRADPSGPGRYRSVQPRDLGDERHVRGRLAVPRQLAGTLGGQARALVADGRVVDEPND